MHQQGFMLPLSKESRLLDVQTAAAAPQCHQRPRFLHPSSPPASVCGPRPPVCRWWLPLDACIAVGRKRPRAKGFFLMSFCLYSWEGNLYPKTSAQIFWAIIVTCPDGLQECLERCMFSFPRLRARGRTRKVLSEMALGLLTHCLPQGEPLVTWSKSSA